MSSHMCEYLVLSLMISNSFSVETKSHFPPPWNQICDIKNQSLGTLYEIDIKCTLSGHDPVLFKLKDLHPYSSNLTENVSFKVDISCANGGNLSMSLPMKIDKLTVLKVKGCAIYDYINDWNDQELENIKDSLVYLRVMDSKIMYDFIMLIGALKTEFKGISNEWQCGNDETLKEFIYTNISSEMYFPGMSLDDVMLELPVKDLQTFDPRNVKDLIDNNNPSCNFTQLDIFEETWFESMHSLTIKVSAKDNTYPNLKLLNYSHNGMGELPVDLDYYAYKFPKLLYVDYSYNRIETVTLEEFRGYNSDQDTILDVRHNNISDVNIDTIINWSDRPNTFVDIRKNPLNCGCIKRQFIMTVQNDGFFVGDLLKYKYIRDMTCASPETARGLTLSSITEEQMGCSIPTVDLTIPLIIVGVVAAILILIIVLAFRYRKEIKIILYIKFNILLPWDKDRKQESKCFDAFFSYSSADADWVYDFLQKELENPIDGSIAFKLCLHQRDFIGGKSVLDNIMDSIENSRHTVVILSTRFITSIWAMAEFKQAYEESITKKHRHLIIVKYEDVPEEDMDSTLKRCLKTFTYLDVKDSMFVDRLRFALATKQTPSKNSENTINREYCA